ncbi:tetratricopeptide repeat protein [Alloalcanivorax gelatiniphagus]|uniref:Transport permease protein n=2 Tax=Alloalcanivorax gelatiniphagus TaxID=1194167 RepID=A0ABY2XN45_9GAMM|nr:tetratricopeptide repeat protein [Alloalcanivorax gelatiniphagus]
MAERRWRQAAGRWATLRVVYPEHPPVWIQAAVALRELGSHGEALSLLSEARARFPDHPGGWVQGANTALAEGDVALAGQLLDEARARFPQDPPVWIRSAHLAQATGDPERALHYNQHARDTFPDWAPAFDQHAELAMAAGDWDSARQRWAEVRRRFPDHPAGYRRAAMVEEQQGRPREARRLRLAEEHGIDWLEEGDRADTVAVAPPRRRDWRNFVDLVWTKARLNLKAEANRNHLRYLWWVIDPLLYMAVFYVVFGLLLHRGGEGFVAYLLTGLVPFQWFAKTVQHASNTIVEGRGLMNQVRISPLFFPLVAVVQNAGKQTLVFLMLAIFLVVYGLPPTVHWLALIPVVTVQLLLMAVVGCALAMIIPFVRDLINLVPTGLQFLLFCSGVFYTLDTIPERWRDLFMANPMANLLHQYRRILLEHQWPEWSQMGWLALGCLLGLGVLILAYRRLEGVFPRVVVE